MTAPKLNPASQNAAGRGTRFPRHHYLIRPQGLVHAAETDEIAVEYGAGQLIQPCVGLVDDSTVVVDDESVGVSDQQFTEWPAAAGAQLRETVHTIYNQSYALASWLARERPGELRAYLIAMLTEPAGQPTPQRHLELFEQAFGDVDAVEEVWLRRETRLENVR